MSRRKRAWKSSTLPTRIIYRPWRARARLSPSGFATRPEPSSSAPASISGIRLPEFPEPTDAVPASGAPLASPSAEHAYVAHGIERILDEGHRPGTARVLVQRCSFIRGFCARAGRCQPSTSPQRAHLGVSRRSRRPGFPAARTRRAERRCHASGPNAGNHDFGVGAPEATVIRTAASRPRPSSSTAS